MGKAKTEGLKAPKPFGYERMEALPLDEVVEALGVAHTSRAAF